MSILDIGLLVLCCLGVWVLLRHFAAAERARIRREEWDVYAEVQHNDGDINPPGDWEE